MATISVFNFSLDRATQIFTADGRGFVEPRVDPDTGEVTRGYQWNAFLDGRMVATDINVGSSSFLVDNMFNVVAPAGMSEVTAFAFSSVGGNGGTGEWRGYLHNYSLAEVGQVITDNIGGIDIVFGSEFGDQIRARAGNDHVEGGGGNDQLFGGLGADRLDGGADFDLARYDDANYGNLVIRLDAPSLNTGAAAGDTYIGVEGIVAGSGNDTVVGNGAGNFLYGRGGADALRGLAGSDRLLGEDGNDNLFGGAGADAHDGGAGLDLARYDDANYGNLVIRLDLPNLNTGAAAGDTYSGIEGLVAGAGNDTVAGNAAANYLYGRAGNDVLNGLGGSDILYGEGGADRFVFTAPLGASNVDRIMDFQRGVDDILLSRSIFGAIGTKLDAAEFGADANNFIIHNRATGQLFYDANGASGGPAPVLFATVTANTILDINDFVMV